MGREIKNPRTCGICGEDFDWPSYGVILDVRKPSGGFVTFEFDNQCAFKLVEEIRGQDESLLEED